MSNHHTIVRLLSAALVACFLFTASACAGKRAAKEKEGAAVNQTDMTRPPVTIGKERDIVVESNPDETISFEEWKRRQAEGATDEGAQENTEEDPQQ